jgi:hypothetical protein
MRSISSSVGMRSAFTATPPSHQGPRRLDRGEPRERAQGHRGPGEIRSAVDGTHGERPSCAWRWPAHRGRAGPHRRLDEDHGSRFRLRLGRQLDAGFGDVLAHVIGWTELIANKRAAGRAQDIADVSALERLRLARCAVHAERSRVVVNAMPWTRRSPAPLARSESQKWVSSDVFVWKTTAPLPAGLWRIPIPEWVATNGVGQRPRLSTRHSSRAPYGLCWTCGPGLDSDQWAIRPSGARRSRISSRSREPRR